MGSNSQLSEAIRVRGTLPASSTRESGQHHMFYSWLHLNTLNRGSFEVQWRQSIFKLKTLPNSRCTNFRSNETSHDRRYQEQQYSEQTKQEKSSNPDRSPAVAGAPTAMYRNSSFHLLCPLRGRAAVASVAGNPICKFKMDLSVSLGGVALNEPIPTQHCSSCPRTLFQCWSLPRAGAFVNLLSEANVSQDICSTWELFP